MDEIRRMMLDRRLQLSTELGRLTEPPSEGAAVSFGKRVAEGTSEAVERLSTTATARSISASIADIDRALAKIESDTYGTCDDCGAEIENARLEARPASWLCVSCAGRR